MSKRSIILIFSSITIIILGIVVYFIVNSHNKGEVKENLIINQEKEIQIDNENVLPTLSKNNEKVNPNATLIMKQVFNKCGHTTEEVFKVPTDIVNLTEEEVEDYYIDWELESFSKDKIIIYKKDDGICEEHFILKDVNGFITIYRENNNKDEVFVSLTDISTKYIPEEDVNRLKQGIKIVGKKDLSVFLEDFE